jgi:hypothetical protein
MSSPVPADMLLAISRELETQSLNAVVAGFSFAAALSWMDVVRWSIHQVVRVQKNGGMNYALTASPPSSPLSFTWSSPGFPPASGSPMPLRTLSLAKFFGFRDEYKEYTRNDYSKNIYHSIPSIRILNTGYTNWWR